MIGATEPLMQVINGRYWEKTHREEIDWCKNCTLLPVIQHLDWDYFLDFNCTGHWKTRLWLDLNCDQKGQKALPESICSPLQRFIYSLYASSVRRSRFQQSFFHEEDSVQPAIKKTKNMMSWSFIYQDGQMCAVQERGMFHHTRQVQ